MSQRLLFVDAHAAADAVTFAGRASRLGDGAVRLQGGQGTLAMTSAPLAPRGLMDSTPTVLVLRALPVDAELSCDLVVDASALRLAPDDASAMAAFETQVGPGSPTAVGHARTGR